VLANQALYCLSHTANPFFALVTLEMADLTNYLSRLVWNLDPPDLGFLSS
jgi:hypothetical protein